MKVNEAELQWYLEHVAFPATRMEIVNLARDDHAPDGVIDLLERLPDKEYSSPGDVVETAGVRN